MILKLMRSLSGRERTCLRGKTRLHHIMRCLSVTSRTCTTHSPPVKANDENGKTKSTLFSTVVTQKAKDGDQILAESVGNDSKLHPIDTMKIHYLKTGHGKNILLLLPGALGAAATDFGPQLNGLNKDLFTVIGWDPPGYGTTEPRVRDFTGDFLRRDAHYATRLMEGLNYPKYSLLGWSDGGITALMMASMFPERVNKLVVWGANSYLTKEETEFYDKIRNIDNWSEPMRKPFIDLYGEEYFRKIWEEWIDNFVNYYHVQNKENICKDDLPQIRCPTLVVHGKRDPVVAQFHADYISNNVKDSRLEVLEKGKHNVHLRYPKEFNDIVETFLLQAKQ